MGHKFLEELNWQPIFTEKELKDDPRNARWKEQEEIYGFNDTETWDMDATFYLWLYEHLRMYEETAKDIVDLNYDKFSYKGKPYTHLELMHEIMDRIKYYFSGEYYEVDPNDYEKIREIGEMWTLILPYTWW